MSISRILLPYLPQIRFSSVQQEAIKCDCYEVQCRLQLPFPLEIVQRAKTVYVVEWEITDADI